MMMVVKIPRLVVMVVLVVMMVAMVEKVRAARVLMTQPIGTRSHKHFFMAIAENLVQRNHLVTIITEYPSSRQHPNIREVVVPESNVVKAISNLFNTSQAQMTWEIFPSLITSCSDALGTNEVQALFGEEFDLVMMYFSLTECFLSFVHKLKVPFIYVCPNLVQGEYSDLAGTAFFPSLKATYSLDVEYPLTFSGRIASTLTNLAAIAFMNWIILPRHEAECRARHLCPEDMPSLKELRLNSSLFITNSVRTMETPTIPYTPTVVHAGGIHCRPAKPLPEDLQHWVAGAGKPGLILFSLGSLVKSITMPEKYRRVLVDVFGSLQQRVLWKWDNDTMENLPPNVRLSKWLPQQDILGHQQLRLFITHGGLLSTQEASYHGVPILGIPIAIDQHHNMRMVQKEGWGRVMYLQDLNYDNLRGLILQAMDDRRLQEKVKRRSRVMRDQPVSPGDWVTYWVEYVLRYQGAVHLRSPAAHIPWYQLYNVDVWMLLVVATMVVAGLVSLLSYKILQAIRLCCCGSKKTKTN